MHTTKEHEEAFVIHYPINLFSPLDHKNNYRQKIEYNFKKFAHVVNICKLGCSNTLGTYRLGGKVVQVKPSIHIRLIGLVGWLYLKQFGCHAILMGKSHIKWRQRPDMTIAVDWNGKQQFKQTNEQTWNLVPKIFF